MKSLLLIPVVVAAVIGLWAAALCATGMHIHPIDPIAAGVLVVVGASLGLLPILLRRKADPAEAWQAALAGTIIHLLATFAGAAILLTTGVVSWHGQFPYWLIAAYWTSLFLLTKQLRQLALKVHGKC
jgi:hypothetical protein